jgi:hypothetical protein
LPGLKAILVSVPKILRVIILLVFMSYSSAPVWGFASYPTAESQIYPMPVLAEGRDFATLVLRDAWDMQEYSDVSQYLNQSGQSIQITDVQVENGVFSARSVDSHDADANFHVLFPGYDQALFTGKTGHNFPIDAETYRCLYIAMKVESGPSSNQHGPDHFRVFWFANEKLNIVEEGGIWGLTKGVYLYEPDEYDIYGYPNHKWKLYHVDLSSPDNNESGPSWTKWSDHKWWQGLRIDPTVQQNVKFQVDWLRLTDCEPIKLEIPRPTRSDPNVWVSLRGSGRQIMVSSFEIDDQVLRLDTQGLPPGMYEYHIEDGNQPITGAFEINQTPIAHFLRPSFTSGKDYASQFGNPWNFRDGSDFTAIYRMEYSLADGLLHMITPSGVLDNDPDPVIELNAPTSIVQASEYRYLTFRMYTDKESLPYPWQNVPGGMVVRWVWGVQRHSSLCYLVSNDIPFDGGWQTITVDFSDPYNAAIDPGHNPVGECHGVTPSWNQPDPVNHLRFDPNENILGVDMVQKLDWIRLTKVDEVTRGQLFPVQIALNKPLDEINQLTYFYTNDLENPTKFLAEAYIKPELPFQFYLPVTFNKSIPSNLPAIENGISFIWDTKMASPGEYYICIKIEDDYNQAVYCSQAPMKVTSP